MSMLYLTREGEERLDFIIENINRHWSGERSRELDVLGLLESRDIGMPPDKIVNITESRRDVTMSGDRDSYFRTIARLRDRGYLTESVEEAGMGKLLRRLGVDPDSFDTLVKG